MMVEPATRIVQLTDCHLFSETDEASRGIATRQRLRRVIEDIRGRVPDFDLLVVTGDTAHDEMLGTYEVFREELGDWVKRLRIIPGNHDDRVSLRRVLPDASQGIDGRAGFQVDVAGWLVLGLDSHVADDDAGELGAEQLEWLRSRLETQPEVNALLCIHHPPITVGSEWLDGIRLQDATELAQLLVAHPRVQLIISGHVHQETSGLFAGARVYTTPAVARQFRPRTDDLEIEPGPPGYRVVELGTDGAWSTRVIRCSGT